MGGGLKVEGVEDVEGKGEVGRGGRGDEEGKAWGAKGERGVERGGAGLEYGAEEGGGDEDTEQQFGEGCARQAPTRQACVF